jgi:hypothetical protein
MFKFFLYIFWQKKNLPKILNTHLIILVFFLFLQFKRMEILQLIYSINDFVHKIRCFEDGWKLQNGVRAQNIKRCGHFEFIQYSEVWEQVLFARFFQFNYPFKIQNFNWFISKLTALWQNRIWRPSYIIITLQHNVTKNIKL